MSGIADFPLSDLGRREVALLTSALVRCGERFAAIFTSPLMRARETALPLAEAGLGELVVVDALREIDCGELEGVEIEEVKCRYPELWAANLRQDDPDFCWPGGERYNAFRARCVDALKMLAVQHPGERLAVVTHAGVISQMLGVLAGTSAAQWERFRPGNTAITELRVRGESGVVVRFDDREHLAPR
jgi:broad specificity phosphatase PhoE